MANLIGSVATNEGNQTSRVYDFSRDIVTLSAFTPWLYNLALAQEKPSIDIRFQWDEIDYSGAITAINATGGYGTGITSFVVDDASIFTPNDNVINLRTQEIYTVTTVTVATNTIVVLRDQTDSTSKLAALVDGDTLMIIGAGMEEGSTIPTSNIADSNSVYNYCQIFREAFNLTGSRLRTMGTPGMDMEEISTRKGEEFIRNIERAFMFGSRDVNTTNFGEVRHNTGGLNYFIQTNVESVGGTMTQAAFVTFLAEHAFDEGSDEKWMFAGETIRGMLSAFTLPYWQTTSTVGAVAGLNVTSYTAPAGQILNVVSHKLLKGDTALSQMAFIVDPSELRLRYTQNPMAPVNNGQMKLYEYGIDKTTVDAQVNEYFAEIGFEVRNERKHAILKGVTGAA